MASVVAQCHYIFGLRTGVINNICYFDEQTVIFPCGNNCVRYNIDQRWQRFIPGTEKSQGMQALAISANRRYLAVSERGEKGTITVYDLQHEQSRKRKVLSGGEVPVLEFVSMAFSPDSKYLIGQAGAPDWTLFYWMWEKQKVMASVKTTGSTNPINQVSFNPQDNTQICVSGNGVFKLFRYAEGALKQSNFLKLESHNFLSHTWMSEERVIAGTETGRLLVFESGDLRWEMSVTTKPATQEADRQLERRKPEVKSEGAAPARMPRITAITSYSKGFACSAGPGTVCLFEKTEEKDNYRKTREIRIPADPCSNEPSHAEQQEMVTLCISPSEETLVTSTDRGQLYSITLSSAEMSKGEQAHFEFLSHSFHSNIITGLSICIRKPLIATCSLDHSVRIWNFETNVLELHKEFQEEAFSVALHPSGLFILVGFSDKLRLMNLLIDDVRTFKEFTVRGCRECVFSHGGHMFAAVNGNLIHIYSSTTFDNLLNLKGHNGKVRAIVWSTDDSRLVSCGMDGAVYEWNTLNSKRESESVLKSCSYTGVTISPDAKTIFAVGTDCTLKEIQDCQILREVAADDVAYTTIAMSRSGRVLFAGTSIGTVRAIKYPLSTQKDWIEYQAHSGAVTKMVITFDDQYLLTVSEDCCLLIWKIIDKEGRGLKRDKDITYAEEILITKSDLEEKNQIMMELKTRVEELKMENEYQLRLKDMNYNEKIKDLSEKFVQEIESLKTKNQVLKTEKEKQEMSHLEVTREVVEKHSREQQDFESTSNQKLMLEYEKYQELQLKSQLMQEGYERQLQAMEDSKGRALEELTLFYEAKLQEKMLMLGQCQDESRQQMREFEESKKQMEEDGDREIQDIRIKYERKLRVEKEINLRLKGETGVMRKKFSSLQKDIDDRNVEIEKLRVEQQKLRGVIKSLEKDILGLKKEIQERDETIQDKEKRIYDLKKKNQELEKFKFVLDYKIKELKKQIEPRENDIKEMKEQIQEMEGELDQVHKRNTQLELNITELKLKLKATDKEMHKETQRVRDVEALVRRFKTDLHNCVGFIQEPKRLKDSIRELYDHYVQQSDVVDIVGVDADIQREYSRQREHLERNVASLKRKLAKDTEVHRTENVKIMKENVSLIKEINDLRRELRLVRTQVHDNKSQSGISKKKLSSSDLTALTSVEGRGLVARLNFEEEAERIIQLQRVEIQRLKMQMQGQSHSLIPPSSSTKLPVLTT
ncbi:cilia- and flagella-associated protein 57 isoform X1 [Oncorhynchus kisutch]|uniref:cilia- and flagella-associated protein 57 isoform X1 n=1 Tax=Oncorhynchus kisutch TaxID=8019 RepID=UPI0012DD8061|nr:cilia- and flagella-associated protein 57-like isoform X1 [Oncorhynchus kisutch]XP_031663145.1 cilia- and flagella-associated protein 57-like isoform X1 [Oncorhynchus kisutch]